MDTCPACLRAKSLLYENLFAALSCGVRREVLAHTTQKEGELRATPHISFATVLSQ